MAHLILIVDDDELTRMQLRDLLEYDGYEVAEASDGREALLYCSRRLPDMVLLDALMPVMDGFCCCAELQTLPGGSEIPILMVTGLNDASSVEEAFAAGASDYVTKPINWHVLRKRVGRLLSASQTMLELRNATEQAQRREQQLRMALEAARMGTWEWDIQTNKITWSENLEALFGLDPNSFDRGYQTFINKVHPGDRSFVAFSVQQALQGKAEYDIEFRVVFPDGSDRWIASKGAVVRDTALKPVRMFGVDMDITKRKLGEEKLRQSQERFQIVSHATNDAVWDADLLADRIWWNDSVQTLFGYLPAEANADPTWWRQHIHPEDQQRVISALESIINNGGQTWLQEYRFRRSNGDYACILDRGYVVRDRENKAVRMIGAMMDISDRVRTQQELLRQHQRSQLFADVTLKIRQSLQIDEILQVSVTEVQKLLNADRVLIFQIRPDSMGTAVKEAVIPGFPVVLGQNIIDPCFTSQYMEQYRQGRVGMMTNIETADVAECYKEFLSQFAIKANLVVPILQKNQLWGLLIAHQCSQPRQWTDWEAELLLQLADQIGVALVQAELLQQETRRRQELARSNYELQQFAFIASHDLQEPLRKIKTFGDRLKDICGDELPEQGHDYLQRMQKATTRMQALIEDLLTLSRVTTRAQPFVSVNLSLIVQDVLSDLELLREQTKGVVEVGKLPTINADPLQMRQLLQNLIGNALKFHRKQVPPVVKIYSQFLLEQTENLEVNSEFFQIIVSDNGIGFDEKYLDRIFNVFQRLHGRSEYEGTGIGLAICRKIVERHHGSIAASSELGQGATFTVTLPTSLNI